MRNLIRFSLANKFAVWLLTFIIVLAGLYSGLTMKKEIQPNIKIPYLGITTAYPGAAPENVVDKVSKPLEQALRNVEGLRTMTSTSLENASNILLEFDYKTNLDEAKTQISGLLGEMKLPDGVQKPELFNYSPDTIPIMSLSLTDDQSKDSLSLSDVAEQVVRPALEDLKGVGSVQTDGQSIREVSLRFDPSKLKQYGLQEETIKEIVQGSSVHAPLGLFEMDAAQKVVVVDTHVTTIEDLKNVLIPILPGNVTRSDSVGGSKLMPESLQAESLQTVKLGDLASIKLAGRAESISRTNGQDSIRIGIIKTPEANTVDVANRVKEQIAQLQAQHHGLKLTTLYDQGKPIEDSVSTMLSKAAFGALFAVLIILLFLRNIRSTLISVVSIPLSLLIAVLILRQMDITLNMMTLGAMTIAIGRVVDDSIVVIENIYRRMSLTSEEPGGSRLIISSTREMFAPILSSTLVTIAVFLPLAFVSGQIGALFQPFALTIVFALLASLLVAITLVPSMAHSLCRRGMGKPHRESPKPGRIVTSYQVVLKWCLSHKIITLSTALLLLVGSLFLVKPIGTGFMPATEQKEINLSYTPQAGQRPTDLENQALKAEKYILSMPHVKNLQYSIGNGNLSVAGSSGKKSAAFYISYDTDTPDFKKLEERLLAGLVQEVPQGSWADEANAGGTGGNSLVLSVQGESMEQVKTVVDQITKLVQEDKEHFKNGKNSLSSSYEQYTITADQQKLSKLGLTAGQMVGALSPASSRSVLTEVKVYGNNYNVYLEADPAPYSNIKEMEEAELTTPLGTKVKVREVASVTTGATPDSIIHTDGKVQVEVSAEIISNDVNGASSSLQDKIDKLTLPAGVKVSFGGITEQIVDAFTQLGIAMAAAIGIVYLVLVITFGGGLAPFAILFSLPFSVIGVLVALLLAGEPLNVSALMGILMLIGIVVTNAIVLVDRVIHKEREGLTTREALLEAGSTRLRPILMTALATIGALLPMVGGLDHGSGLISRGLGVTVIGGITSSTLLTLVVVPVIYEILMKLRRKKRVNAN